MKDFQAEANKIEDFIFNYCKPFSGAVIGLSGGLDSAVVATLAVRALGPKRVHAVLLPANMEQFEGENMQDAIDLAMSLGISHSVISLESMYKCFEMNGAMASWCFNEQGTPHKMVKGNIMARLRMVCIYAYANKHNCLVLGTTNKTEAMIGYYTKWGDGACDIEPIIDIFKTDERIMARTIGVPEKFITKKPTADLWAGQTDEGEIGMSYEELDEKLKAGVGTMPSAGGVLSKLQQMIINSEHKRHMPGGPEL